MSFTDTGLLLQFHTAPGMHVVKLDVLKYRIKKCVIDIEKWLVLAAKIDPASSEGIESFFMRLRVAMNKDGSSEFHEKVTTHQQKLSNQLVSARTVYFIHLVLTIYHSK
jgi:hypothetical protein